jgi:uncharacterized protein (DUF433 family)
VADRELLKPGPPEEIPRYSIPEAAGYLHMSRGTLASWVAGRPYKVKAGEKWWYGLIKRPEGSPALSFHNLVEAYTLHALRVQYGVKMDQVRAALAFAQKKYGIERFLRSKYLRAIEGNIFLQRMEELVNVGRGGQTAMPEVLGAYLKRIEFDASGLASKLSPVTRAVRDPDESPRVVLIDPRLALGRPVVRSKSIRTATIGERFDVGESVADIAADYGLPVLEVEEAIRYQRLAEAA